MSFNQSRPLTGTVLSLLLAACASEPKIDATRLAGRSSVEVKASLSDAGPAASGAFTKSEGAAGGAAGGAGAGLQMWGAMGEVGLAVLVFAPAVIVGTAVAGAGIGAASGAAAGTNYTREDIDRAVSIVDGAFAPDVFSKELEGMVAKQLRGRLAAGGGGACVTPSSDRGKCSRTGGSSVINMEVSSRITASSSQSGSGELDFVSHSTFWIDPKGVLSPDCVTLIYRYPAGNLFDLAANSGAPVQASFQRMLGKMSEGMMDQMFPGTKVEAGNDAANAVPGTWKRESCDYATRLLSKAG